MKLLVSRFIFFVALTIAAYQSNAQTSCVPTNINGTIINLPCGTSCTNMRFQVPHLKSTSDYKIVNIPFTPFLPYATAGGNELTTLYQDDQYGPTVRLPFPVCFFDSVFTKAVVGSNGIITFDTTNANCANAYTINPPIPSAGTGAQCSAGATYYPRAAIMGAYTDLDPRATYSAPDRKIEWRLEGTAPCRKLIVSYYRVGMFGAGNYGTAGACNTNNPTTLQIVVYESTGLIDVYIEKKACNSTTAGGGLTILGIQDWTRTKAVAAPGKNSTIWSPVTDSAYRFVPSGAASRFVKAELLTIGGSILATTGITAGADTATTTPGLLDIQFPQQCPAGTSTQYIVKTYFSSCSDPNTQMISVDTVTVNKTTSLNATATTTAAACGPNGSITVNVPTGIGSQPFAMSLDGGTAVSVSAQTYTFTGVTAGTHTVTITDPNGCAQTLTVTVALSGTLTVTNTTASACVGASNGSITINPQNGTAPHQYQISNGPSGPTYPIGWQTSNTFNGLPYGTYVVNIKDNSGCILNNYSVTINPTTLAVPTPTVTTPSCNGASNGSITVNPPTTGTGPYQYSFMGGAYSTNNVFSNLASGTYFIAVKDATGCQSGNIAVTVGPGSGVLTVNLSAVATSCNGANNGSITVTPTSGSGPYQYSLNGGAFQNLTGTSIGPLAPGTYSVVIKDGAGCSSAAQNVTIAPGAGLTATVTPTATSCSGAANGSITVVPNNGGGPFQFTLNGGAPQSTGVFNNIAAGTYSVTVSDGAGCSTGVLTVTVAAGPAITGTATSTTTSCSGASDGTITANANTGTAPYTYSLNGAPFQSSNTFTNVPVGNHTIVIKDASGCATASIPVSVAAGPVLAGTATSTATSCAGAANGSITVNATVGTGPFTYSLDNGTFQSSNTFINIAAGSHNVVIKNAAGCTSAQIPVTVAQGSALTANATPTATSCNGASNGSFTITPNNGSGPYQYSFNGSPFTVGTGSYTGLAAGTYTVTVQDASGCASAPISVTIAPGPMLAGTASATATSCSSATNGSITVTPSSSGTFTYSLNGGAPQASNIFNNVPQGSYSVVISNNLGCSSSPIPVTVAAGPVLAGTATSTSTSCNGANNGSITVTPTNGSAPYQYSLNGAAFQLNNTFTNLAPNTYTVVIKDAAGCTSQSISVTVGMGSALTANVTPTATSCNGAADGAIAVSPTSGSGPYQYSLDGSAFAAGTGNFSNISSGNHTIVVKDGAGCSSLPITVVVPAGAILAGTATSTNTSCLGATNGSLTITPGNGTGAFTYTLNGGTPQTSATFNNLVANTYTVVFQNNSGCVSSPIQVTINPGPAVTASVTKTDVTCNGGNDGSATVTLSGNATAPFLYSLNPGGPFLPGNSFPNLPAGNYTVYFKEANNCTGLQTFTIAEPTAIGANTNTQPVTCNGLSNGVITISATGGTAPYQYSIDGINYQSGNTFNVAANTYTVYVKDANGCIKSVPNVTVTQPAALATPTAVPQDATCTGNGAINVTASGGTQPYSYSSDGVTYQASNILSVTPNTYTVYVKDANGCIQTLPNVTVGLVSNLTLTHGTVAPICEGKSTTLPANTNASQFHWTSSTGGSNFSNATPSVSPTVTTDYYLVASLGNCVAYDTVTVTVYPAPIANAGVRDTICFGQTHTLDASGSTSNGSTITNYLWGPATANFVPNNTVVSPTVAPTSNTTYTLSVTDARGCNSLQSSSKLLVVTPPLSVVVLPRDTVVSVGDTVRLVAFSVGTSYVWAPNFGLLNNNTDTVFAVATGDIVYQVTATTNAGCKGDGYATIKVYEGPEIYVPNAFTPNRDGKNDIFRPFPVGIKELKYFRVFNRWGQLVYETKTLMQGWDGSIGGKEQPTATYIWLLEAVTKDGRVITKKGTVTLIR